MSISFLINEKVLVHVMVQLFPARLLDDSKKGGGAYLMAHVSAAMTEWADI